uniref:TF-B3 domain-containing protein n=2 Tax=Auxenochlorella protothecoides TaxID=3075 RepID=A0A1D1ZTU5_AUXPR
MTQSNITAQSLPSEAESPQSALGESPAAPVKGESFASLSELSAEGLPLPLEVAEERLAAMGAHKVFEKTLTPTDATPAGLGRIVIPKRYAESCFPSIPDQTPVSLEVHDAACPGMVHSLRMRYWSNNRGRMYLLEETAPMVALHRLTVGDVVVFGQAKDGRLCVVGRKGLPTDRMRRRVSSPVPPRPAVPSPTGDKRAHGVGSGSRGLSSKRQATRKMNSLYDYWAGFSLPPRTDGVFRAVYGGAMGGPQDNKVSAQHGAWSVTVSVADEVFQAFFEDYDTACAQFNASVQGT